jgi:hypothetical protein
MIGPIDVTRRLFHLASYQPGMTMRPCWQVFAAAVIFLAASSVVGPSRGGPLLERARNFEQSPAAAMARHAEGLVKVPFPRFSESMTDDLETSALPVIPVSNETKEKEPDTDIFALMSGTCSTLRIAGRDFACRSVAYFHSIHGRAEFTIALDDPTDDSHVISFSGDNGRREQDNLYELPIDRMLLNSKDRPKVDGLPVPFVESAAGVCRQVGNFATRQVSSISCTAIDKNSKKYELQFESDGSPMTVRRVRQYALTAKKRRAKQVEQLECRYKADVANVLPRDRTAYILQCLAQDSEKAAPAADQ